MGSYGWLVLDAVRPMTQLSVQVCKASGKVVWLRAL